MAPASARRSRLARGLLTEAAVLLLFVALAALAVRPLASDMASLTLATGDPLKDMWSLHWLLGHLGQPSAIFGGNTFHPLGAALICSEVMLGTAVLLLPLHPFLRDPVPLYNAGVLLALAFSGWSFHALVRDLTGSRPAGVMSGVLAGFASQQLEHLYHLPMLNTGWLALYLLGLHRLARRPGPGPALLAGLSAAVGAQTSGYFAVAAVVLTVVFAALHVRTLFRGRALGFALGGAALALVLTAPYVRAYMALRDAHGLRRPPGVSMKMSFHPAQDLGSRAYVYRDTLGARGLLLFPGLLSLGLGTLALARRRPETAYYGTAILVLLVVALGPSGTVAGHAVTLPYAWLTAVPPLDSMRHPFTFATVAVLLLAVLAGIGAATLRLAGGRWAGLLPLLAVVETVGPPPRLQRVAAGVPPAYEVLRGLPRGPVLDLPVICFDCMVWAARHGLPTINGQGSAYVPPDWMRLDWTIRNHWLDRRVEDLDENRATRLLLERFPVRYVILPVGRRAGVGHLVEPFDRSRLFHLAAVARDGDRIYEVSRDGRGPGTGARSSWPARPADP
ncbi:MAG TPA: hypothetical protein VII13_05620 [Vicinamibacteria bacterium]|jgi:hypothetical protein